MFYCISFVMAINIVFMYYDNKIFVLYLIILANKYKKDGSAHIPVCTFWSCLLFTHLHQDKLIKGWSKLDSLLACNLLNPIKPWLHTNLHTNHQLVIIILIISHTGLWSQELAHNATLSCVLRVCHIQGLCWTNTLHVYCLWLEVYKGHQMFEGSLIIP